MTTKQKSKSTTISWWLVLLKGVFLTVFGIWMFKMPYESFYSMLFIIGLIISLSGILEIVFSIYYRNDLKEWWWNLSGGILDLLIGGFLLVNPDALLMLIALFISFWLVVRGVLAVREAIELKKQESNKWKWILLLGIALLLLAVLLIWHPQIIGITVVFWIAISFIILGIFRIILAFKLQNLSKGHSAENH